MTNLLICYIFKVRLFDTYHLKNPKMIISTNI